MSTKIEWTQETWNPTIGCDKVSAGCKHCYAIRMAWRLAHNPKMQELYADTVTKGKNGQPNWTGIVKVSEAAMDKPLRYKKPTMFFVDSMSDLFHKEVPFEVMERVFAIMAQCPQHTFQILTKRPERIVDWFQQIDVFKKGKLQLWLDGMANEIPWPLPNVWLGVSVEDQQSADERIPHLLKVPAAVRFLSCEPLLGRVNLANYISGIDQVIAGGESGPSSRPMHPDWPRLLRDQCTEHDVAFFFKQWGDWAPLEHDAQPPFWRWQDGSIIDGHALPSTDEMENSKSWDDGMWCIAENEEPCIFKRVGKSQNTKLLDGVKHTALPETKV